MPSRNQSGRAATTRFDDPRDTVHDLHAIIDTLNPGAVIPCLETRAMEPGPHAPQGKGADRFNRDRVEVEAGEVM